VRNRKTFAFSSVGIVVGIGAFVFFLSLGAGIRKVVLGDVLSHLPVNVIEVVPRQSSLNLFSFSTPGLLGGGAITDDSLERIRAIPGVAAVAPEMVLGVPIQAYGQFFGKRVYTDLAATGIDPSIVAQDVTGDLKFEYDPDGPIPVLASTHLLELYNSNFSDALKLPKLSREAVTKIDFKLVVGKSYLGGNPDPSKVREYPCRVAGVSPKAVLVGITIPLEYVRRFNADYGAKQKQVYKMAYVTTAKASDVAAVGAAIEAMGFEVDKTKKTVGGVLTIATLLLTMFSVLIVALAAVNIAHTFFMVIYERRREIGVMRSVGATRGDIRALILGEAACIGAVSGTAGIFLGWVGSRAVNLAAARFIPPFPYKPEEFFMLTPGIAAGALVFAVAFCFIGAAFPATRAATMDPAEALRA
jgi:ABC-type antimicrobial peptide transport system permease subunit